MEQTVTKAKSRLRPRRIIERPRLTRLLDSSNARVRMLIAPAGYGKTTLAEQWTAAGGRQVAWYRCRPASADVALLAVGIADAASGVLPGCDRRIRERMRATQNPPAEVEILAEMVAEDLEGWHSDAWFVIDDYHLVCTADEAERFVEVLVERSSANFLVASRQRPSWVSRRDLLYGHVTEVDQRQLAMVEDEAERVLDEMDSSLGAGLISLANGWPAVVGLAGVSEVNPFLGGDPPKALYDFFAEEVFGYLDEPVRRGLALLALPPVLDRELTAKLLGSTMVEVLTQSEALGLLTLRADRVEMHPLAQTFLSTRQIEGLSEEKEVALASCLAHYRARAEWDAAFELIQRHGLSDVRGSLLLEALPDLLGAAQITTIETWATPGTDSPLDRAICDVALGEVALRQARHAQAKVLAERALRAMPEGHELEFRALKLAGQAEHARGDEVAALELFRRAEKAANTPAEQRDARWAQSMASVALELDEAPALLDELAQTASPDNPAELVRLAGRRVCFDLIFGSVRSLEHARRAEQLLGVVSDPFLRCAFRNPYAHSLALNASYEDALRVADDFVVDATEHKLLFMLGYASTTRGIAHAGRHDFESAHAALDEAWTFARSSADLFLEQNAYSIRMRVLAQQGRLADAATIEPPSVEGAVPSMVAEVRAAHGLVLACLGRFADALLAAQFARTTTHALEASTLAAAIDCVIGVESGEHQMHQTAEAFVDKAFESGAVDILISCYRARPNLLGLLLRLPTTRERVLFAVKRAGDEALAEAQGQPIARVMDPLNELSDREREICELVSEGLSNGEIAQLLFVSEATVKSHLHHVFEKLGIRSRHALALRTLSDRMSYAAPIATAGEGAESEPG
jgi:ATP/maltotriose-dependent transcriptional regulator MalT